jgi:hypothetical protein
LLSFFCELGGIHELAGFYLATNSMVFFFTCLIIYFLISCFRDICHGRFCFVACRTCLLEERGGDSSFQYDAAGAGYTLKWRFHNELGLVFVAVYQRMLHLLYPKQTLYHEFDDTYRQLLKESEANAQLRRVGNQRPLENLKKGSESKGQNGQMQRKGGKSGGKGSQAKGADEDGEADGGKPKAPGEDFGQSLCCF